MKVMVPFSMAQELLIEEHLFNGKRLFVAPDEYRRLTTWVARRHPEHKIREAMIDIENGQWVLELQPINVTT